MERRRSAGGGDGEGRQTVKAFEDQDSSLISVFAASNALIRMAPDAPAQAAESLVDVLPAET